jgi:hypothetical protein
MPGSSDDRAASPCGPRLGTGDRWFAGGHPLHFLTKKLTNCTFGAKAMNRSDPRRMVILERLGWWTEASPTASTRHSSGPTRGCGSYATGKWANVRKWWNWQTHHLEGVAPKGVGVQIPPSAPDILANLDRTNRAATLSDRYHETRQGREPQADSPPSWLLGGRRPSPEMHLPPFGSTYLDYRKAHGKDDGSAPHLETTSILLS